MPLLLRIGCNSKNAILLFYGTLSRGHENPAAQAAAAALDPGRPATVTGALQIIETAQGCYPVLAPGKGRVHGWLHRPRPTFDAQTLALLDAYEECRPRRMQGSDYARRKMVVRLKRGGRVLAWVYCGTRRSLTGRIRDGGPARPLPHGCFRRYLAETGAQTFGEAAGSRAPRRKLRSGSIGNPCHSRRFALGARTSIDTDSMIGLAN